MTTGKKLLTKLENALPNVSTKEITKIIATSSAKASAISILPIPFIDIAGVTYVQLRMVNKIAESYGVDTSDKTKLLISSIVSSVISRLISVGTARIAASANVDKLLGQNLIKATISGFITTITGEVYADHFKNGGKFDDISGDVILDYFMRQLNSDRVSVENVANIAFSAINDKFDI